MDPVNLQVEAETKKSYLKLESLGEKSGKKWLRGHLSLENQPGCVQEVLLGKTQQAKRAAALGRKDF